MGAITNVLVFHFVGFGDKEVSLRLSFVYNLISMPIGNYSFSVGVLQTDESKARK